jgi:hypothetical protein
VVTIANTSSQKRSTVVLDLEKGGGQPECGEGLAISDLPVFDSLDCM